MFVFLKKHEARLAPFRGLLRCAASLVCCALLLPLLFACASKPPEADKAGAVSNSFNSSPASNAAVGNNISFGALELNSGLSFEPDFPTLLMTQRLVFDLLAAQRPYFIGANSARLNAALLRSIMETGEKALEQYKNESLLLNAEPTFAGFGLISYWLVLYRSDASGEPAFELERTPFNYDIYKGVEIELTDCFGGRLSSEDALKLAGILTDAAAEQGYTLISRIEPPGGSNEFIFLSDENGLPCLGFYFHQYEIALPSDGRPLIIVPVEDISEFAQSDGAIMRAAGAISR